MIHDASLFRNWIDEQYKKHPLVFPTGMDQGYHLHDKLSSIKQADILNIKRTNQLKFDLKNKLMKQYTEKLSLAEDQIDSVIKELQENKISLKNALKKLE